MRVSLIVAMDSRGLIGDGTGLPWHLPADLRRFRTITWGKPIIMGRRTFESIGKPLPGRLNIVLTRDPAFSAPGCRVARTLAEALAVAESSRAGTGPDEAVIIGGGQVYAEAIARWDRLYLTVVHGRFEGNTYFPIRELLQEKWRLAGAPEYLPPDEKNRYGHSFHVLERAWDVERQSGEGERGQFGQATDDLDLAAILARNHLAP